MKTARHEVHSYGKKVKIETVPHDAKFFAILADAIKAAMNINSGCWWTVKEWNDAINEAKRMGWARRRSTTQAEWTDAGIDAADVFETFKK